MLIHGSGRRKWALQSEAEMWCHAKFRIEPIIEPMYKETQGPRANGGMKAGSIGCFQVSTSVTPTTSMGPALGVSGSYRLRLGYTSGLIGKLHLIWTGEINFLHYIKLKK